MRGYFSQGLVEHSIVSSFRLKPASLISVAHFGHVIVGSIMRCPLHKDPSGIVARSETLLEETPSLQRPQLGSDGCRGFVRPILSALRADSGGQFHELKIRKSLDIQEIVSSLIWLRGLATNLICCLRVASKLARKRW
jgi:hypothetical protein